MLKFSANAEHQQTEIRGWNGTETVGRIRTEFCSLGIKVSQTEPAKLRGTEKRRAGNLSKISLKLAVRWQFILLPVVPSN